MSEDWSESENTAFVAEYFAMLVDDLAARSFNKVERYRLLAERIPRPVKSIERKCQNVSAVMLGFGQPRVQWLKPARHYCAPWRMWLSGGWLPIRIGFSLFLQIGPRTPCKKRPPYGSGRPQHTGMSRHRSTRSLWLHSAKGSISLAGTNETAPLVELAGGCRAPRTGHLAPGRAGGSSREGALDLGPGRRWSRLRYRQLRDGRT